MRPLIQIIVLSLTLLLGTAYAQQVSSEQSEAEIKATASGPTQKTTVDKLHAATTELFRDTVNSVDSFFADDDYSTFEENTSRFRLRLDTNYVQDHGWELNPRLKFKIVLPGLGDRFRLVGNDDEGEGDNNQSEANDKENDVALRWVFFRNEYASVSGDVGVRIKSSNLDPFLRLNTGLRYDISENWFGKTSNKLTYYTETDWRDDFRQSFNRKITDDLLFRARTRIQYFDENSYNPFLEQKFSLFHTLDSKSALAYEALWLNQAEEDSIFDDDEIIGELQDNYQQLALRMRYRRNVWRDWLFIEFWPIVAWPEERDWETVLAGLFRLEITFGAKGKSKLSD